MGKSKSEAGHRMLASHLLRNLQTWGYFKPHIYLMKEEQDVRYANSPEKFKAALHFGVNFQVVEPILSKADLLRCIYSEIYWQRNKFFDEHLGLDGSRLRDEWLQELAHRLGRQFVSRAVQKGPVVKRPGPGNPQFVESWLVEDPRSRLLADLSPASLIAASDPKNFECSCCQDLDPLAQKKDIKLLQVMFGNCAARDLYNEFRKMAEKRLAAELEARKQWWEQ